MHKALILTSCLLLVLLHPVSASPKRPRPSTVFQTSTIDALLSGVFDGEMTAGELARHGGFGLGTFDALDGELVADGGRYYQVRADGKVYPVPKSRLISFATVTDFRPGRPIQVPSGLDLEGLQKWLDTRLANKNLFYAIRITGRFSVVKTRAIPHQKKPYPSLADASKKQHEFNLGGTSGVIVGFRCPPYVTGINVPGYHFHYLTSNRKAGGHVLKMTVGSAKVSIQPIQQFTMALPSNHRFARSDLSVNRTKDLEKVEKDRK
jgi:acetolactate decarboxylase